MKTNSPPDPYQLALGLLARREYSRRELQRKLQAKGASAEEIAAVLGRLADQGWQDDTRFAGALARTRAMAGYGPRRIQAELAGHGLGGEAGRDALDTTETNWAQSALALLTRRYASADLRDPKVRNRALGFLLRRGFDQSTAYATLRKLGAANEGAGEDAHPSE